MVLRYNAMNFNLFIEAFDFIWYLQLLITIQFRVRLYLRPLLFNSQLFRMDQLYSFLVSTLIFISQTHRELSQVNPGKIRSTGVNLWSKIIYFYFFNLCTCAILFFYINVSREAKALNFCFNYRYATTFIICNLKT